MRVIVNGARGRMGQVVCRFLREKGIEPVAVDQRGGEGVYLSLHRCPVLADVVMDFSNHAGIEELLACCQKRSLPLVAATTGYTAEEFRRIRTAAKKIPIFQSYNMSLGVALLVKLTEQTAALLEDCEVEIVETHHRGKADAPSGTALLLAETVKKQRPDSFAVCGRNGQRRRQNGEIGIHSLRMGNAAGEHTVYFSTGSQSLSLTHTAHDRVIFAEGAFAAANFLLRQTPGLYHMEDLLKTL